MADVARLDAVLDRLILAVATRSGRTAGIVALVVYLGLGLALPLGLAWPVIDLVAANVLATTLAGSMLLGWFVTQARAQQRRQLVEWTTDLRLLDAVEFEWLVGELFRREGWMVEETGGHGAPDGNIDLRMTRAGEQRVVQCKRWTSWMVGVDDIRAFAGALLREGLTGSAGVFVTLSDFYPQARDEGTRAGLTLLDGRDLFARVDAARRMELCPICETPMVLDRSMHGWWFRCVIAGCRGKRDLGRDPARAVELLTEMR